MSRLRAHPGATQSPSKKSDFSERIVYTERIQSHVLLRTGISDCAATCIICLTVQPTGDCAKGLFRHIYLFPVAVQWKLFEDPFIVLETHMFGVCISYEAIIVAFLFV